MNRRHFVAAAALAPLALRSLPAQGAAEAKTAAPAPASALEARSALTLRRVLKGEGPAYSEEFLLADLRPTPERRFTEYSGDLSGRYIGALASLAASHGEKFPSLDALVQKAIGLQKPEGYFGAGFGQENPTDAEMALLWGNGRLLVGLVEYYRLRPSPELLACCRRLGDFLVRVGPLMLSARVREAFGVQHFASSYICWMEQTEGLAQLYMVTKDERFRKLAEETAAVIEFRPSDHVHGCLTAVRGVLDLYTATGEKRWLTQCEEAWHKVASGPDALITGGVPEGWSPNNHRTEGCGEADWLRLSLGLWRATGKAEYLEAAERTYFNEFSFNQYATGDYGHHVYTETGLPEDGAVRAWWCCTLHGLRAFPDVEASAFRVTEGGLRYELPVDGRASAGGLTIEAKSSLAEDGTVRLRVVEAPGGTVRGAVRKPRWADEVKVALKGGAGRAQTSPAEPGYMGFEGTLRAGDEIEIHYATSLRTEPAGAERVAFRVGPWLLGAPADENPAYANELTLENRIRTETSGEAGATPGERSFAVPVAARSFGFVSAEFPDQPARVTLRAVAEQTGRPTTSWELRFLTAKG